MFSKKTFLTLKENTIVLEAMVMIQNSLGWVIAKGKCQIFERKN